MKVATIAMGIGLGAFLMTGCGGPTDDGKSDIVGTWTEACYKLSSSTLCENGGTYRTHTWTFEQKEFSYSATCYSDEKCKQDEILDENASGTYSIGGKAKDINGKDTTELDFTTKKLNGEDANSSRYSMYRFDENDGLLIAVPKGDRDGKSSEKRRNYIGSNWKGATKQ